MPASFDRCVKQGGKVRTEQLGKGKYRHICIDENGKAHMGYVKTKKPEGKTTKNAFARAAEKYA